ncbi:MAG: YkvA family protein [Candidatus Zixiibacteriota bacterium]
MNASPRGPHTLDKNWWRKTGQLMLELRAIYLACRDRRVRWYTKAPAVCLVGYAFSPIDLIPDPIPVLGQLDDLVLIPLGIVLIRTTIPERVLAEYRQKAMECTFRPDTNVATAVIIALWLLTLGVSIAILVRVVGN